jgi:hypothetical protein
VQAFLAAAPPPALHSHTPREHLTLLRSVSSVTSMPMTSRSASAAKRVLGTDVPSDPPDTGPDSSTLRLVGCPNGAERSRYENDESRLPLSDDPRGECTEPPPPFFGAPRAAGAGASMGARHVRISTCLSDPHTFERAAARSYVHAKWIMN